MANGQRLVMVDDSSPLIQFNGPWFVDDTGSQDTKGNFGPVYNKTQHGAIESASLSFAYNGSFFAVMGSNNVRNDSGVLDPQWECFVDGIKVDSNPFQFFENNWWLCEPKTVTIDDGPHILTVNATISNAQTFWIDRIDYVPSSSVSLDDKTIFVDNHDPELLFGDGWETMGTTANITRLAGSSFTFFFEGVSISWFAFLTSSTQSGVATWSVDDSTPTSFNIKALPDGGQYNQEFFRTPDYPPGQHKLSVVYLGPSDSAPLILDYLVVRKTISLSGVSPAGGGNGSLTPSNVGGNSNDPGRPGKNTAPLGAIVGGGLGALALILSACLVVVYFRRRHKVREAGSQPSEHATYHHRLPSDMTQSSYTPTFSNKSRRREFQTTSYQPLPISSKFREHHHPVHSRGNSHMHPRSSDVAVARTNNQLSYGSGSTAPPVPTLVPTALADPSIPTRIVQHQDSGARTSHSLNRPPSGRVLEVPPLYTPS